MNFGVITADSVPPEQLQRKWVILVQNWPQVCSLMVQILPAEERGRSSNFLPDVSLAMSLAWPRVHLYRLSQAGG